MTPSPFAETFRRRRLVLLSNVLCLSFCYPFSEVPLTSCQNLSTTPPWHVNRGGEKGDPPVGEGFQHGGSKGARLDPTPILATIPPVTRQRTTRHREPSLLQNINNHLRRNIRVSKRLRKNQTIITLQRINNQTSLTHLTAKPHRSSVKQVTQTQRIDPSNRTPIALRTCIKSFVVIPLAIAKCIGSLPAFVE